MKEATGPEGTKTWNPNSEDFLSSYELNLSLAKDTNIRITRLRVREPGFMERGSQNRLLHSVYLTPNQNILEATGIRFHHLLACDLGKLLNSSNLTLHHQ